MKYSLLISSVLFLSSLPDSAQQNTQQNTGEIIQSLQKLKTVGSVLYVAAHPDDENTRLLAYLASEKKCVPVTCP